MKERRCSGSSGGRSIFNATPPPPPPPPTIIHSLSIIFPRRRCIRRYSPWWEHLRSLLFAPLLNAVIFMLFSHCLSKVIVMNISFLNAFMWFIVRASQGQSGATWRGILPFLFPCVLLMYLFWALSVSLGPAAHSYSLHRVVEITSPAPNARAIHHHTFH